MPPRLFLLPLFAALALALLGLSLGGGPDRDHRNGDHHRASHRPQLAEPFEGEILDDLPTFRVVPLRSALNAANGRYRGRVIAAELAPPRPAEAAKGVQLVYALRMLTPEHDLLLIRLDARDASFLDVAGNDLGRARRAPAPAERN
ncbi:hypothetical protein KTN05_15540 [Paracoccus sp. Z118]|uniref:PepSY domain-containing protein n=1 Tax=Paracoccus sp. Z118 TaxID=2851017 RepID=UPI001C2BFF63|nr:hypothetical protein [Paracoccus sp. Z118]MBV0893226.1 hypothetical protein [Paracoccus sp. Z118]